MDRDRLILVIGMTQYSKLCEILKHLPHHLMEVLEIRDTLDTLFS